ncbi:hypothetical protein, partial [Vibrio parahaemolyticus]|uniref:hypothetical protein n=1 Tax=Vibrio parahaemolyticus TaxID=670 RepID=UPI00235F6C59
VTQKEKLSPNKELSFYLLAYTELHLMPNAALRGEQRIPPKLSHCAVNTKADSNQNCQAL